MSVTLGFTGDVMLGRNVNRRYAGRLPAEIWGNTLEHLTDLDGLVVNLECCLSTRGTQWARTRRAFHFRADPDWAIPALEAADVDWCALANNHLLDYETEALLDTIDALEAADIGHAGAGPDEAAARRPSVVEVGDLRVGVCSFTDNTPEYAAGPDRPGVARLDMDLSRSERAVVRSVLDKVRAANVDLVVASLHWGPNNVEIPDERYRTFGRWLIEEGVDVVHGHSAHVFQGIECREDGLVLYDCGDLVDDYRVDPDLRNDRSFLFELTVDSSGDPMYLRLRPLEIRNMQVHAVCDGTEWWRDRLRERSAPFGTAEAFERRGDCLELPL